MATEFASSKSTQRWDAIRNSRQNRPTSPSLKTALLSIRNDLPQKFTDKAILSFRKRLDFRVLLQLVDIFNTTSSLNTVTETFELLTEKIVYKFDSLHIQDATACSLEKVNFKRFKLLYLLNHICYFIKICRMCGLNPHQ